ncbi:unnamed protein product [Orchesella dallaii]|uniref:EB domain-containing protein n=1 Tax=Orchesella dallaii TaxID=48710 RepID=A0ABP1S2V9_9HEXA
MGLKLKSSISFLAVGVFTLCVLTFTSAAHYGEPCSTDGDCDKDFACNIGTCDCFSPKMFYDDELKMCFSYVGNKCTREDDGLIALRCVPNAECRKSHKLPSSLGFCTCKSRYESENSGKRCTSPLEKASPKVTSMDQVVAELFTLISFLIVVFISGFQHNESCSTSMECFPRETFLRCNKGHCLCSADSDYDLANGYCRLKINVKCFLSGKNNQPCVKGAYCDPPSYADGKKIQGASTGNCKCYQGETNEEDGTCSSATSLQRSFGYSNFIVSSSFKAIIIIVAICVVGFAMCII